MKRKVRKVLFAAVMVFLFVGMCFWYVVVVKKSENVAGKCDENSKQSFFQNEHAAEAAAESAFVVETDKQENGNLFFQTAENISPFLKPYADILAEAANDTVKTLILQTDTATESHGYVADDDDTIGVLSDKFVLSDKISGELKAIQTKAVYTNIIPSGCQKIRIYAKNWFENEDALNISDDAKRCTIMWLGSRQGIIPNGLEKFYAVWASTPLLQTYLKNGGVSSAYVPLFYLSAPMDKTAGKMKNRAKDTENTADKTIVGSDATEVRTNKEAINPKDRNDHTQNLSGMQQEDALSGKPFFAIIGSPPSVEEILHEKSLPYRRYDISRTEQAALMMQEMPRIQAIFAEKASLSAQTMDLHPLFLAAAEKEIPLIVPWIWPQEDTINLFNDNVSFYPDAEKLRQLVAEIEQIGEKQSLIPEVRKRAIKAAELVRREYSPESIKRRLRTALATQSANNLSPRNNFIPPKKNSINIDIPSAVGHYTAGDYALAFDLADALLQNSAGVDLTFYNSLYKYPAETYILLRGFLPPFADDLRAEINIIYLAYAQFGEDGTRELVPSDDEYLKTIIQSTHQAEALATASQTLAALLRKKGVSAYYVPQFTNPMRFYSDFSEDLKSNVLFVGTNKFYRTAVPILLKHGVAVDVYGPHWPEGTAKATYADNLILRKYYSSAKIVLNDTRDGMKKFGFISNRIFDATACGTLVISDYMPEIEEIYGDSVPMWKTEEELVALVKYYLNPEHEKERLEKAKRAREITLKYFTADKIARKFEEIISEIKKEKQIP